MSAEVTVVFRDDFWEEDSEYDYDEWLRESLEQTLGFTVLTIDVQEV